VAEDIEPEEEASGISRRTLIKRAAIIGGIAWATPLIATTPAFAAATGSTVIHACCACNGCPSGATIGQADHQSFPSLASSAACASFCTSPPNNCTGTSIYETGPNPCTFQGAGQGNATCVCP